jgi:hypothetical protein
MLNVHIILEKISALELFARSERGYLKFKLVGRQWSQAECAKACQNFQSSFQCRQPSFPDAQLGLRADAKLRNIFEVPERELLKTSKSKNHI